MAENVELYKSYSIFIQSQIYPLIIVGMVLLTTQTWVAGNEYCDIVCGDVKHTKCLYTCNPAEYCGNGSLILKSDKSIQNRFLKTHNTLRNELALGMTSIPKASNMLQLVYDLELEDIAACFAATCQKFGVNDKCRNTKKNVRVGQNSLKIDIDPNANLNDKKWIEDMVISWSTHEEPKLNESMVDSFGTKDAELVGNWSQIIWAKTGAVGCARVLDKSAKSLYVYCNYGVGGNSPSKPIYKIGKPCSKCPYRGGCSSEYKGLCVNKTSKDVDDESYSYGNNRRCKKSKYDDEDYDDIPYVKKGDYIEFEIPLLTTTTSGQDDLKTQKYLISLFSTYLTVKIIFSCALSSFHLS